MAAENLVDWHVVDAALETGQYQHLAEVLDRAQAASQQRGDTSLSPILAAAHRICLALGQCQAEVEWHQQALQQADQREHELGQQLQAILDLAGGRETPATDGESEALSAPIAEPSLPTHAPSQSPERPSLWRRMQERLGRRARPQSPEQEPPKVSDVAPSLSFPDKTEALTAPIDAQSVATTTSLVAYCLGPFRVFENDQLITEWNGLKAKSIFKYLLAHPETRIAKDILIDIFWPEADPEAGRRNLHQAIYSLRQTLRREQPDVQHVQFENDCYLLNPELNIWLDYEEFEEHVQSGRCLEAAGRVEEAMAHYGIAEGLFQGDFMEEDLYEDWPSLQRDHMRSTYLDIVDRVSEHYVQTNEYTAAIALCQKALARDRCYEQAHRRLMQCYLLQGQRYLAIRQYQACAQVMQEDLDLTPSEETMALYRHITSNA